MYGAIAKKVSQKLDNLLQKKVLNYFTFLYKKEFQSIGTI